MTYQHQNIMWSTDTPKRVMCQCLIWVHTRGCMCVPWVYTEILMVTWPGHSHNSVRILLIKTKKKKEGKNVDLFYLPRSPLSIDLSLVFKFPSLPIAVPALDLMLDQPPGPIKTSLALTLLFSHTSLTLFGDGSPSYLSCQHPSLFSDTFYLILKLMNSDYYSKV